jgi:hypothetical protein
VTPHEVAADDALVVRFQTEVAYLDRLQPLESEMREDAELLNSKDRVLIIAWLWPELWYRSERDPFSDAASGAAQHQHRQQRYVVARRFEAIIEFTARAVGRSVDEVTTHLEWSAPLTQLELDRLLRWYAPFPFPVIVRICRALQLEYADEWVLVDPQRLAGRIDQSVLASTISGRLRSLTLDNLETLARRLPRLRADAGQAQEPGVYRAPGPAGRYWSLYAALAADVRADPDYTLAEIDRLLVDAGEERLPASARANRSWWAGNGAKPEGRPQVSAWWAAGYRIAKVTTEPSSGQVRSIGFEALPGRAQWLADPERAARREYRVPGPERVGIFPVPDTFKAHWNEVVRPELAKAVERLTAWKRSFVPDDPDIRHLVKLLDRVGEADRAQIERDFSQARDEPVDAAWMTNLLTRARRQGWTANEGTRSQPRWTAPRSKYLLILHIAEILNLETPAFSPGGAVPVEFLRLVAKTAGLGDAGSSAPQIARSIVESSGGTWQPEFESVGNSVTTLGLRAVRDAIHLQPDGTRRWVWRREWDDL